jgi:2-keto-4-pentenoate hydratase/2-oxohepta-3-ene-1,7-dioic acid hydratase in catechol pathway
MMSMSVGRTKALVDGTPPSQHPPLALLHPSLRPPYSCDGPTEPALRPGDVVEVACDRIGVLRNRVVGDGRSASS